MDAEAASSVRTALGAVSNATGYTGSTILDQAVTCLASLTIIDAAAGGAASHITLDA